nr:antibiotic biosynthesis monooxygenase family protein [Burkholderia sp. Bp8963]
MILEMAHIEVLPGTQAQFEAGVKNALPLFARAKGCGGAELHRIVEHETRYVLIVRWETVEDHTVHFRQSDDFQEWRRLVGACFAKPPEAIHTEVAVK